MLVLVVSLLLAWWSFTSKRDLGRRRRSETVKAKFFGHLFEWSLSLAIVLLFYQSLIGVLALGWRWITVGDLQKIESSFVNAQRMLNQYKPTWTTWMAVFIVLYLVSNMWIRFLERDTPFLIFKKTKRFLHVVNTIVFLFASFTLLGFQPGKAAATLEIHLRKARTDYGVLQRELGSALESATVNRAYENALKGLPEAAKIPHLVDASIEQGAGLRGRYSAAQTKYGVRDNRTEILLKQYKKEDEVAEGGASARHGNPASESVEEGSPPETATCAEISKARASVEKFIEQARPGLLRLLRRPGGKEIALELPSGAIEHLAEALKPVTDAFPVFKPVFEIMKSTLTDAVKQRLKRQLDDLTKSAIEHPSELKTILPEAAQEIADSTPPKVTPEVSRRLHGEIAALQREGADIRAGGQRLDRAVTAAEAPVSKPTENRAQERNEFGSNERPERPRRRPGGSSEPDSEPSSGGYGGYSPPSSTPRPVPMHDPVVGSCICNEYINGILVASYPISLGASCGPYICGQVGLDVGR
jgi:hypothetical protein